MGNTSRTLGNPVNMPAAVRLPYRRNPVRDRRTPLRDRRNPFRAPYAAPRCSASQTAVDSLTPSSTAFPQWAIQAAIPSGLPDA